MTHRATLSTAADLIRATIRATAGATLSAHEGPRKALAHIDAAQALQLASAELAHAALDIAEGAAIDGHAAPISPNASRLAVSLRIAENKLAEAKAMLHKAEARRAAQEAARAA